MHKVLPVLLLSSLAAVGALVACGSSDSSNNAGGGGTQADGGKLADGGTATGTDGASAAACLDPASFNYAVPLRKATSGGPFTIYQASSSEPNQLFWTTLDEVFSFGADTKTLTSLYAPPSAIVPHHYLRAADVVVESGTHLWSVPKAGGTATALPELTRIPAGSIAGNLEMVIDGDTLYALDSASNGVFYSHAIATGTETVLATELRAQDSSIRLGPDAIYSYYPNNTTDDNPPTTLFKIPKAGGAIAPIAITGAPGDVNYPIGVTGTDLYVLSLVTASSEAHILRAPASGGAAVDLGTVEYILNFKNQSDFVPVAGGVVIRIVDSLFWIPTGATAFKQLTCVDGDYSLYSAAVLGTNIYVNVVANGQGGVITLPLP